MSDSSRPHGLQPTRFLRPWVFQARVLEWVAIAFSTPSGDHDLTWILKWKVVLKEKNKKKFYELILRFLELAL